MDTPSVEVDPAVPEHFLAALYGASALALGAAVWSAMAAVFGAWSLAVVPGLGWMVAWACRYGGRRDDSFIRAAAWLLALAGVLLALLLLSVFSVTQTSLDPGSRSREIGLEYLRLFAEPPWFGSVAVLLTLAGAWRALRVRSSRSETTSRVREAMPGPACACHGAPPSPVRESDLRAA
jgi:hypothetical protein